MVLDVLKLILEERDGRRPEGGGVVGGGAEGSGGLGADNYAV